MDINEIVNLQKAFDREHGWSLTKECPYEKLDLINKDLIGIVGEIGEFSNIVKKLNLASTRQNEDQLNLMLKKMQDHLEEELIDTFIYLIRISTHLDMDIPTAYLEKLNINKRRFKSYEIEERD